MTAELLMPALSAIFAAGGAWAAVRVELRYIRRDVDELRSQVQGLIDGRVRPSEPVRIARW